MDKDITQKFNEIFDLTLNRLDIPLDTNKATPLQASQVMIIKDFNDLIFAYTTVIIFNGGNKDDVFNTLRAYLDMIQLMLTELK